MPVFISDGIRFEGVSFRYPGQHANALSNLSFYIKKGERIAIVGENGAGKSTLVKLLLGLYRPSEGIICYDGVHLEKIDPVSVRSASSLVLQDFMQYQYSVEDNICFGDAGVRHPFSTVEDAANKGGANTFIQYLPQKYQTRLGKEFPSSTDLSGGQWQRLAMARGFVRNSQVFVLDEPTASLDPMQEAQVYESYAKLNQSSISLMVSHRLGACKLADRIFVVSNHKLEEIGTHDELMRKNGKYANLYREQAKWYV
ncbi:ABC transporter ATP-binding protein [Paenibacillus sp. GYB003]|uniref:ABC transporter ATP-binding protein n=1 Tax=Paenibacillus sp. GYB003 TaxID=2994392 RepID=UPI002F9694F4